MKRIITFWKCQLKDNPRVPSPGLKLGLCFCSVLYWTLSYVFITLSPTKTSEKKFFFFVSDNALINQNQQIN